MRRIFLASLALLLAFAGANAGFAQGVQTASLTGSVTSNDGQALPGVTVTVTSPALIGERMTTTGVNGDYIFRGLPPGQYTVMFTLEGMQSVERTATLPLGGTARSDATMEVAAAEETIVVTGEAPSALETTTVGANFEAETIEVLPAPVRTPQAIADLSGGVNRNDTQGVAGQVTIGGAFAYDNIFMVNGVDVNDRFFGTANNLFIEDAIEETQVLTGGVSAEFGRFSGGVINAITKSGGNQFTGSFRVDYNKPEWRDETPFEDDRGLEREGDLAKIYAATLGGPIIRDAMWFFLAGRQDESSVSYTLFNGYAGTNQIEEPRYEVKLTGAIASNHTIMGSYLTYERKQSDERQVNPLEYAAVSNNSTREQDGFVVSYNGVFTNNLFGELRYSEKHFGFRGLGNTATAPFDSVFYAYGALPGTVGGTFNAPYFDASDPEDRDNEQWYGALSYFLSTESAGSHDIKAGIELFNDIGIGGNSQTSTGYNPTTDFLTDFDTGDPIYDANGDLQAIWLPYYYTFMYYWVPVRGARNELETTSIFVNDRWNLNANWSFNVGVRYEQVSSTSESGVPKVESDSIVPRLGVSWDVKGDGKFKIDGTYSEYAGRATGNQFGAAGSAGNPAVAFGWYVGPEGIGNDFAPGYDLDNYIWLSLSSPTQTTWVDPDLKTPRTREYTLGAGMQLPKGGYLKAIYTNRDVSDFIETFTDRESEVVDVSVGPLTGFQAEVTRFENTNDLTREYEAVLLQGSYRITDAWMLGGNWTHELKNDGNFEGEVGQTTQIGSTFGDYPEVFNSRNYPSGTLDQFKEDKVRFWTSYTFDFGRGGSLDLSAILRYDSPLTFSYTAPVRLTPAQNAAGEGYLTLGSSQTLFFGERGRGEYDEISALDLALQYGIPVWKTVEPWIKFTVQNVTNEKALQRFNTQILPISGAAGGPVDSFGRPTTYNLGPNFGRARSSADYQVPREYFISAGIRF